MSTARGGIGRRAASLAALAWLSSPAWAYRPFVSTDADVAAPKTLQLEAGLFGFERRPGRDAYISPQGIINLGLGGGFEGVGEFRVEHPERGTTRVTATALDLKGILKQGFLQGKAGISLAEESTLLVPSRSDGEQRFGAEETVILSQKLLGLTLHWNLGAGLDQESSLPFGAWGLIAERPLLRGLRAVGEINGSEVRGKTPDNSGLVGFIWDSGIKDLTLDAGYRRGLSGLAVDWAVTAGFTLALPL